MSLTNQTIIQSNDPSYNIAASPFAENKDISGLQKIIQVSFISGIIAISSLSGNPTNGRIVQPTVQNTECIANIGQLSGLDESNSKQQVNQGLLNGSNEANRFKIWHFSYNEDQVTPIKGKSYIINEENIVEYIEEAYAMNNKYEKYIHDLENVAVFSGYTFASVALLIPLIFRDISILSVIPGAGTALALPLFVYMIRREKRSDHNA